MFKKKGELSLPPLPKPPTSEQMVEDIKSANFDDPVFLEGSCKKMFEERTRLDVKFETVKEFIDATNSLDSLFKETAENLSRLQDSREELEVMKENVKKQAVEALK